jgi:GH35 family endo-1,4-beta-xylanase
MKTFKKFGIIIPFLFLMTNGYSQFISIVNKKFVVNGNASCPIYMNGANTPWEAWNDFGGSYDQTKWNQDMVDLKSKGINAARIWFSCNGSGQPSVASDGTASAPTAAFWKNCDSLFASAKRNGVYIMATMMSFDHTKTANTNSTNWQQMMNTQAKTQTYIDNYLIPFVNRYKTNPSLWCIDLCNEIEWIAEDATNWKCSYAILQRFVGQCAASLHGTAVARTDGSKVLVTLGSAGTKWNATKMRNGSFGTGWQNNSDGNKWSDAAIQAQFSNTAATLDFYSPHFYGWLNEYYSNMFEKSPTDFGMDEKLCMVGEMPARDPFPIPSSSSTNTSWTMTNAMNALKTLGWQGHQPWTANITTNLTTEVGDLADFGAAALAFKTANSTLIVPTCAVVPKCQAPNLGADLSLCGVTGGITLNANITTTTNKTFTWYKGTTQITGTTGTVTGITTAGTYVVKVDSASATCVATDTIIISSTIPTPAFAGVSLCTPAVTTLNSGVTGTSFTYQWSLNGTAINGETASTLSNIRSAGTYKVDISASGCTTQSGSATITSNLPTPGDNCRATTGIVALSISNATGTNYAWYNSATAGTSLGTGLTFNTPSISATTTYYVQNNSSVNTTVGPTAKLAGTSTDWGVSAGLHMQFTVSADFQLLSFKVPMNIYNAGTVTMTVEILDGTGTAFSPAKTFTSTATTVAAGNDQLVSFTFTNLTILKSWGTSLRMRVSAVSAGSPLYTSATAAVPYPYTVANVVSLTGSTGASGNQYMYFYNWSISTGSACDRLPVIAKIDPTCTTVNKAPTVSITSPSTGSTFSSPASIALTATASDIDGTIANVKFYNGTTLLATITTAPYSYTWTGVANGTYNITAVATDDAGASTTATAISVTVATTVNQSPTVSLTSPVSSTSYTAPASVIITASATDADGTVTNVKFYNGTTLLATVTTAPYTYTWASVAAGSYTITAVATDNGGAITTSTAVSITISAVVANHTPPTCVITAPHNNAYFQAQTDITINVYSSDLGGTYTAGTISKVEFFNGNTKIGEDLTGTSNTFSIVWSSVPAGTYTITAKATDNSGVVTSSAGLIITVGTTAVTKKGLSPCKGKYLANVTPASSLASVRSDYMTYWNGVTAENGCKWGSIEATKGTWTWASADAAYNYAKTNNLMFRYHVFAWGSQYPTWLETLANNGDVTGFKNAVMEYMDSVKNRYPNSIDQIDVLNEQIGTHATGTPFFVTGLGGTGTTGYDWQIWLFTEARKRFPNTKLILNDYGLENDQNAINTQLGLIKVLRDRGLVDGFGTQAHCFNIDGLTATALKSSLDLMATSGLPIYVTELDLNGGSTVSEATQLTSFQTHFPVFWEHTAVAGVSIWGYVEGSTWKTGTGLLNADGTERSCMTWLKTYLSGKTDVGYPFCPATPCATVAPTVTATVSICQGATATALTATGTSLLWYTSASGGTGSSTAPTPSTAATGSTAYYVSQTVSSCEGPRATITVTVNALPTANAGTDVAICTGKSTILTASGGTSYSWNNAIITASQTISPTATTTYSVTVTNASNCKATDAVIVSVNALPTANAGVDVAICAGKSTTITASGGTSYVWNNAITTASNTVSPTATTTFTVTTTNAANCTATDAVIVTVNSIPSAPIVTTPVTYNQNDVASQLSATGNSLLWYSVSTGGTSSSLAPTPSTISIGTASFYVSQTTTSCESSRAIINVVVSLGTYTQTISLLQGWNLISFSVSPTNKTIESVFASVLTQVDEIKNADAFWKNGQATIFNSLTQITDGGAYLVYMTTATTLSVSGSAIATPINIPLKTGWNLVGVPSQSSADIATKVSTNPITAVKNFDGFWNTTAIPSISKFEPGKGYFIKATGPTTVSY